MGARQKQWAKAARAELIHKLGAKCWLCGTAGGLTFDCIKPAGSAHHAMESSARMCFYRQQYRMANLGLLCASCNSDKQHYNAQEWRQAIAFVGESVAILRLSGTPGRGTSLTPAEMRGCIKAALSRFRASTKPQPAI